MSNPNPIVPVILAGGTGTRLWPLSRASFPKQFTTILGDATLFQATVQRFVGEGFAPPIVITSEPFRFIVMEQMDAIGITPSAILIEPEAKNTGPAVALATAWAMHNCPNANILIAPSDHAIPDAKGFRTAVRAALRQNGLTTFGIAPERAETGYGWIELADPPDQSIDTPQPLTRFVEKPDDTLAQRMLESGRHLWNAGLFLGAVGAFATALKAHAPKLLEGATKALEMGETDLGFIRPDAGIWAEIETISVDYAVFEKAENLSVMPWQGRWSDLGSWDAVAREGETSPHITAIDCANSHLSAESGVHLVGIGLEDMIAVALPDAVLVAPRARSQDVGKAVAQMCEKGVLQATEHPRDFRPWGWFETVAMGDRFRVKRIVVHPGGRLSLQSHQRRAEHWVVVQGTAQVTIGDAKRRFSENQSVYVPVGVRHRLENEGDSDLVLIEVQTGGYLGEDDIERFDDVYARK